MREHVYGEESKAVFERIKSDRLMELILRQVKYVRVGLGVRSRQIRKHGVRLLYEP